MPYKRGKKWMSQTRIDGKKITKSFKSKSEAIAWEVANRGTTEADPQSPTKAAPQAPVERTNTVSLGEWATKYLDYAKVRFSPKTFDEKRRCFGKFFREVDHSGPVDTLNPGRVLSYLQVQAQNRSGYAANKDRKNLVAAWNWGMKYMGLPTPNPCLVDRFPEERQIRYVPPERDFWKAFEAALNNQDQVMLLAYLHLAARRSELFGLRWTDVDFAEQRVRLYTRKRRDGSLEYDWLPMTDHLYEALTAHKQDAAGEWVFPEPETGLPYSYRQHWMKRLCKRAGVKPFGIHAIRHLTASILAKEGVPMIDIQSILRHKNLATTERYIRRIASLRPALRVLPGGKSPQKSPLKHEKAHKVA